MIDFLVDRRPFERESQLRSLSSDIIGDKSVNVDDTMAVGIQILESMEGVSVADFKISRKDQANTLDSYVY